MNASCQCANRLRSPPIAIRCASCHRRSQGRCHPADDAPSGLQDVEGCAQWFSASDASVRPASQAEVLESEATLLIYCGRSS